MSDTFEDNFGTAFGKAGPVEDAVADTGQPREMDFEWFTGALSSQVGASGVTDRRAPSVEMARSKAKKLKGTNPFPDDIGRPELATGNSKSSVATPRKPGVREATRSEHYENATDENAFAPWTTGQENAGYATVARNVSDVELSLFSENQTLKDENIALSTRMQEYTQRYITAWSAREAEYEAKVENLERQLNEQRETVESAKAAASLIMEQNRSYTLSDDEVSMWFSTRARNWYEWAKEAAHQDFDLVHEKYKEIRAQSQEFVVEQNGDVSSELRTRKPKRLPYLLLHGLVASFFCTEIFKNPFWILEALPRTIESAKPPVGMRQAVEELNEILLRLNAKNIHQWRAQLFRIFSMAGQDSTLATCKAKHADVLTEKFLNSTARFCLKQETEVRAGERMRLLKDEISRALDYSLQLWAQRSRLGALGLKEFQERKLGSYVHHSELMEPHQSQRSEEPEGYHGRCIVMVVQPAIVAFGTEDGRDYDEISRVWLKARVWMGEPEGETLDAMLET